MTGNDRENRNNQVPPREREHTGDTRERDTGDEARRLDREYTGDAVNARTDELDRELNQDADRLRRKLVTDPAETPADGEHKQ
ncbi:MAG: hypothetical protein M3Q42_00185 [Pseudomonadota bacterium]|nr:hypothetical protein [Pseudomonadota bacterium]